MSSPIKDLTDPKQTVKDRRISVQQESPVSIDKLINKKVIKLDESKK